MPCPALDAGFAVFPQQSRGRRVEPPFAIRMKPKTLLLSSVLALGAACSAAAQDVKFSVPGADAPPSAAQPAGEAPAAPPTAQPPAAPEFTEAQLLETFGWFIGRRVGLAELEFTAAEVDAVVKGLRAAAGGRDAPYDLQQIGPAMDQFMQGKQAQYMEKLRAQGLAETARFLAEVKQRQGVEALPSGLLYEVVQPGTGAYPSASDTVRVHYTGALADGTVFDSSVERGEPAEFPLSQVIPGWSEGVQKINVGGKIRLYVPPELGYGDEGRPGIPPASTLVFDVELLDIVAADQGTAAEAPPAAQK